MTAKEVVERIKANVGVPWNEQSYRDVFKAGNPDVAVKGIATTCMATLDMIQRSHAAGLNLVITHEPTFWSDSDATKDLAGDPIYKFKTEYCLKNDMVVWRFHDHWHAKRPDMEIYGSLRALGLESASVDKYTGPQAVYTIPPTTLGAFAADIKKRLKSNAFRVAGNPDLKVSRIAVSVGSGMPRFTPDVDVVIGGEGVETESGFDDTQYAMDAGSLGIAKGQIILGHVVSEEPGMEECANWLRTFLTGIPVQFVPAGEPFWA